MFKQPVVGMTLEKGDSEVVFDQIYMRSSVFFQVKSAATPKTGPTTPQAAKYQDKHLTIRIYGRNEDKKKDELLGEREILISSYGGKIRSPMECVMEKGTIKKNRLHLLISVVSEEQADKLGLSGTFGDAQIDTSSSQANFLDEIVEINNTLQELPKTPKVESPEKQSPEKSSPVK